MAAECARCRERFTRRLDGHYGGGRVASHRYVGSAEQLRSACELKTFRRGPIEEAKMQKLIIIPTAIFLLAGISAGYARGGMHGHGASGLMAPANPTIPPSLTPDPRLTGSAPLPSHRQPTANMASPGITPDPQDAAVDRMIGNICRGC